MAKQQEQPSFAAEDPDGLELHVEWSRSGKRAIVSIWRKPVGVSESIVLELTHEQARQLAAFLQQTTPT